MSVVFRKALTETAFFSLATSPAALIATSWLGVVPFAAFAGLGLVAAGLLIFITLFTVDARSIRHTTLMRSAAFVGFCGLVALSLLRSPELSNQIAASARFLLLAFLPLITIVIFLSAAISTSETRSRMVSSILIGSALVPAAMLAYDTLNNNTGTYLLQWLSGIRVLDTGLVTSPNVNALVSAFGGLAALWLILERKMVWPVFCLAAAIFYLLITQSRGVLFSVSIASLLMLYPKIMTATFMRATVVVWAISAPLLTVIYSALDGTSFGDIITRDDALYLGVGTGRAILWASVLSEIVSNPFSYLFGTGYMSAPTTAVLPTLTQILSPNDIGAMHQRVFSLHNASLQILFDSGIISLLLFIYCLFKAISTNRLGRANAIIFFVLLAGFNEANGTIYSVFIAIPFFALICAYCVGTDFEKQAPIRAARRNQGKKFVRPEAQPVSDAHAVPRYTPFAEQAQNP